MSVSFSTLQMKARAQPIAATAHAMRQALPMMPPTTVSKIDNGVRVVAEENPAAEFATVGAFFEVGTRTEQRDNSGITRAVLSAALRGTKDKDRSKMAAAIENLGGHVSMNVGREHSYLLLKVHKSQVDEGIAFLGDIVQNADFSPAAVEEVKKQNIAARWEAEELVDDQTMDFMHTAAYDASTGGGLGNSVFGTEEGIESLTAENMAKYRDTHMTGPTTAVVGVGAVTHAQLEKAATTSFGGLSSTNNKPKFDSRYVGGDMRLWQTRMKTAHCAWAVETCGRVSGDTTALQLFSHIQGSWHRSQHELGVAAAHRIFKVYGSMDHGPTHFNMLPHECPEVVKAFHLGYEDTGLTGTYIVGRPWRAGYASMQSFSDLMHTQMAEYNRMSNKVIHIQELDQAKVAFKSQLLFNQDGATNSAVDAAEQVFYYGRRVPLGEMYARIDDITPTNVQEVMGHYLGGKAPVFGLNGAFNPVPGYDMISRWTSNIIGNL